MKLRRTFGPQKLNGGNMACSLSFLLVFASQSSCIDPFAEQVAIMENDIRMPPSESDASSNEFSNAIRQKFLLWPGGVVPYVLADSISK